jgi:putative flavoprotein involved in K+ transport
VNEKIDTVIIGAGHAGLTMSYFLSEHGLEHVIVERGRVGERWISERWDSFHFQFPNWTIELPGYKYQTEDLHGFVPGREIVRFIQEYADFIKAPVRSGVDVTALENSSNSMPYLLRTNAGAIEASNVVIATGQREKGVIPPFSSDVPNDIRQLHSSAYRNAGELPPGAVLVVGSGASGFQIAEDLHQHGRQVYVCMGRHRRLARCYRGRDYAWWAFELGLFERRRAESPATSPPGPLLTGVNGGYEADWRELASKGIVLLGRLKAVKGTKLALAPDLEDNLAKGDEWLANFKKSVDALRRQKQIGFPNGLIPPSGRQRIGADSGIGSQIRGNYFDHLGDGVRQRLRLVKTTASRRARGTFARAWRHAISGHLFCRVALALQTEIRLSIFWRPGGRRGLFGGADRSETKRKSQSVFII